MKLFNTLFILILPSICNLMLSNANVLPDDITKCQFEDVSCIMESTQHALQTYASSGIRQADFGAFDPMKIDLLKMNRNPKSPVSIELKFMDVNIIGLSKLKMLQINGFDSDLKKPIEIQAKAPKIVLKGSYIVNGKVLILPIVGNGKAEITLYDTMVAIKAHPKPLQKDGHVFFNVDAIKLKFSPKRVNYDLQNLFNGDKALGDNMNAFLNENWSDIFYELEPDFSMALEGILIRLFNEAFSKYPYQDYFSK